MRSVISRFEKLGLQRRIMLYVTGGLIVFAAAYSALSLQAIDQSTRLVYRERLIAAGTVAHQIDSDLSHLQGEVNDLSGIISTDLANNQKGKAQEAMNTLYQHWSSYDHFRTPYAIILSDTSGNVVWSDPPPNQLPSRDILNHPPFQAILQSRQPTIADEFSPEDVDGHGSLMLMTPIFVHNRFAGILLGNLNLAQVSLRFAPMLDGFRSDYIQELINENGVVIASTENTRLWGHNDHLPLVKDLLARKQSGTMTHPMPFNSTEPTHILAFFPLSAAPWGVVVEEPQDIALALPNTLKNRLFLFGAMALLAGLVLAWVTTRAVVQPVNALIDVTQRIAAGDLDHPLDIAAEDEVGRLARSFDNMRVELKESHEEIARWNRELEARVRQRTCELSALVKSSQALAATLDLDMLFNILISQTREVVPLAEAIVFFLFDSARELLFVRSTYGMKADECEHLGFHIGEGITGRVFEVQTPVRLNLAEEISCMQSNLSAENSASLRRATQDQTVRSALGVPLISKGARLGALVLFNLSQDNAFTENDVTVLQAFANQAAAAIENARLYASLQEKEAARAALLEQAIQAQEEERARVAREIHDELGQLLTRLSIDLKMCETQVTAKPERAAQTLAATQTLVWKTMEQAHRLIVELRPTLLDELGLEAALREELSTRLAPQGVETKLEANSAHSTTERLPPSVEITVFRIAQEAISNIALHAHATHAVISIQANRVLQVCIEDDGVGMPDDWRGGTDEHRPLGLLGMQERAALIGGTFAIEPGVPHGTRVILRVPLGNNGLVGEKAGQI